MHYLDLSLQKRLINMEKNKKPQTSINCALCRYFFVTHIKVTPWGCSKFNFRSRVLPSQLVFSSTGTKCAYFVDKKPGSNVKKQNGY